MDAGDGRAAGERPSAAELGISEAELARILGDVRRRRGEAAEPARAGSTRRATGAGRRSRRRLLALPLVPVLLVAVSWVAAGDDEADAPGSHYAFARGTLDRPVAYTSCRPVRVAIYPAGGPDDAEGLVREAVAMLREATGLGLDVTGTLTGSPPTWDVGSAEEQQDDPISVSWQEEANTAVLGRGGSRVLTHPDGSRRLVAGRVVLSRDHDAGREGGDEALAVLLHELGHVLGLTHVNDPGELMHAERVGRTSFGPGDLAGLRLLGRGPCF